MISKSLSTLHQRLPRARPWVTLAVLIAIGLLGYYATLGVRYWQTSGQASFLKERVNQLSEGLRRQAPKEEELADGLVLAEQRLEGLNKVFSRPEAATMMALLFSTARDTQVDLRSMVVGELVPKVKENVQYQSQPITVNLQGETANIFRFLSTLQQREQVVEVSGFQMASLDSTPSAQLQLVFYLSPKPVAAKSGTTNAVPPTKK